MPATQENFFSHFKAVSALLSSTPLRQELYAQEIPAPTGLAPNAIAFAAGIKTHPTTDTENQLDSPAGAGRFVLLHDPANKARWQGEYRVVCFAQAPLETDIGQDPFISQVAWSWLIEALQTSLATHTQLAGTISKILSSGFGELIHTEETAKLELRASWTPAANSDPAAHLNAWAETLCLIAGLPHYSANTAPNVHHLRQNFAANAC